MERISTAAALLTVGALIFTGCAIPEDSHPTEDAPSETTPTPVVKPNTSDGELIIGTLYPTKSENTISNALITAVETAVRDINEDGGLHLAQGDEGEFVRVYHRDGGTTVASVTKAFDDLAALGVDAVIAPLDPQLTAAILPLAQQEGIAVLSVGGDQPQPTDGADGYYLNKSVGLDAFGRYLAVTTAGQLYIYQLDREDAEAIAAGYDSVREFQFGKAAVIDNFASGDYTIPTVDPEGHYLLLSGNATLTTAAIAGLLKSGVDASQISAFGSFSTNISKSDFVADAEGINLYRAVVPYGSFLERLRSSEPKINTWTNVSETYDLVIISALASLSEVFYSTGSPAPEAAVEGGGAIVSGVYQLGSGIECFSYSECSWIMAAKQPVKYVGPSGVTIFNNDGKSFFTSYDHFQYTDSGVLERLDLVKG